MGFATVEIREYQQSIVVNPWVSPGPAVGLGWDYHDIPTKFDIMEFESTRALQRRSYYELIMPKHQRETILLNMGYSRRELTKNTKRNDIARRQKEKLMQLNDGFETNSEEIDFSNIKFSFSNKIIE